MHIDYGQIGARIKQTRKEQRITQEMLAEELSVSVSYVSQVERGVTRISLDLLAAIATTLDCEIAYLLDGVSRKQENYLEAALAQELQTLTPAQKRLLLEIVAVLKKDYT